MFLDANDTCVRALRWTPYASLLFHELNGVAGTLSNLFAHVFRCISDGVSYVRDFILRRIRHGQLPPDKYQQRMSLPCSSVIASRMPMQMTCLNGIID